MPLPDREIRLHTVALPDREVRLHTRAADREVRVRTSLPVLVPLVLSYGAECGGLQVQVREVDEALNGFAATVRRYEDALPLPGVSVAAVEGVGGQTVTVNVPMLAADALLHLLLTSDDGTVLADMWVLGSCRADACLRRLATPVALGGRRGEGGPPSEAFRQVLGRLEAAKAAARLQQAATAAGLLASLKAYCSTEDCGCGCAGHD